MVWIVGFMAWIGQPINIIMTILPSIMFVVSMSDVIHLVSKYFDLLREGHAKFDAIKISFKEIGMATFLTSLTTSIGFFSLVFVNVMPIKTFGIYVGIGVLMAFIITFAVLPFLFFYTTPPKMVNNDQKNFWRPLMLRSYKFTIRNKKKISYFTLGFVILLIFGSSLIKSNNFLMDDLKPDNEMKKSFNYMDETFGGVRPFEMAIELKDNTKSLWDADILQQINGVEEYLQNEYGVDIKISLNQTLKVLNRSSNLGDTTYFQTPTKKSKIRSLKRMIKVADGGNFVRMFMDSTEFKTRISGTIPDWGNNKVTALNVGLEDFIQKNTATKDLTFKLTGTAHLLDLNMSYLSKSLVSGLLFAIILVALIMGLLYRSFKMVIISLIPNLIPLLVIGAIMGFFGINLKITTAIVFTISFGIAVDDTIHFLSKFKLELNKGKSVPYALKRTIIGTGKAIILTSAILCSGFLLLLFSDFLGTFYMGLMISVTLFFAVLADLFLLPILIMYFYGNKKRM
jgi:predicted RND superfamily exporter protein